MELIPVILSGSEDQSLWPISRSLHPKSFIKLNDGQSILQKNFLKASCLNDIREIITVTHQDLLFKTLDDYRAVNQPSLALSFILEPHARNTAATIITAALHLVNKQKDESVVIVLPADHIVLNQQAFYDAVASAVTLALQNEVVIFGIKPTYAETNYGYIKAQEQKVLRFIEKPAIKLARQYIKSPQYFWNSGMLCFKPSVLLKEAQTLAPDIYTSTKTCLAASTMKQQDDYTKIVLDANYFQRIPQQSIDYAILEKSKQIAMVRAEMDWTDIGSWESLAKLTPSDNHGNQIAAEALVKDVNNCYIQGRNRLIAGLNLNNLIIVDTDDALLVADKQHSQKIKAIYQQLKKQQHKTYEAHPTIYRPWGSYTILEEGFGFKIKHIEVKPGARLSLQMHQHRSEHWVVVSGTAKAIKDEEELLISANESIYLPAGVKHQLENTGEQKLILIEVQCGSYLGEDDITRFEDKYGRI